ncbi:hypothetical protein WJ63_35115 [Burkholderia pyrrocinia]|nr:hypothetical protein WJ63_35115 [Burkholderia pyrrocinia]
MLTREMILTARDLDSEVVPVPEWGGEVRVGVMGGSAREKLMDALSEPRKVSEFHALMLAGTLVDESGAPIFGESDLVAIARKNPEVLGRLVDVAMRINKIGAGAVEAEEKNSEAATNASSGSGSPASSE